MTTDARRGELVALGVGPVATVFGGLDPATGAAFALKVYPGRLDRRARTELDAELACLARLRTGAGVLVADRVEELPDGRCAVRMELCAPSRLHLVDGTRVLSMADGLALGHSVATALAAAHAAGLVHGNVSPGNVLFRPSGEPVLADFGRTLRRVFPPDIRHGAEYHLAPETVLDGVRDERTDLYGLGMVLRLALPSTRSIGPGEPPGLAELISALLAGEPDARVGAAEVADRLGALISPTAERPRFDDFATVVPTRAWWPPQDRTPAQPHRAYPGRASAGMALAAVGVLAVLAVAIVVLLLS